MSQTLFIALLVLVVAIFVFLYRRKKKVENKMGDELNALIESDDWQGVCRILRKQLVIWGCVLVLVVGLIVARFTMGEHTSYVPIIVAVFIAWRFFKLVRLYVIEGTQYHDGTRCDLDGSHCHDRAGDGSCHEARCTEEGTGGSDILL